MILALFFFTSVTRNEKKKVKLYSQKKFFRRKIFWNAGILITLLSGTKNDIALKRERMRWKLQAEM